MPKSKFSTPIDPVWKPLFRVSGWAALLVAFFIPIQLTVFFISPPPTTTINWFNLFHNHWLIGLLDMDLLLVLDTLLFIPVYLAFYAALHRLSPSAMVIVLAFALIGITTYCASAGAFNMLSLSNQYAAAESETQKTILLAVGQATMSNWQGTAFDAGYVLQGISLLIISVVMLRGGIFNKAITYLGIVISVMMLFPPTAGTIGMVLAVGSVFPLGIWCVLIGLRFLKLGKIA